LNAIGEWTGESIEIRASILWKRTLLLIAISIAIGFGAGYALGRSTPVKETQTNATRQTVNRVRFLPVPVGIRGKWALIIGQEAPIDPMPKASDSPNLILPPAGSSNPGQPT